ncbi:glycosyltransferase family 4 protein, partial [Thermoproteota archaeon]
KGTKHFHFWTGLSIKGADRIIADSQNTKNDILKYYGADEEKIKVVHLAPDKVYKPIQEKELLDKVRAKYNLISNTIFSIGIIEPRKNIANLLEAFKILKESYGLDYKLAIAGSKGKNGDLPYNEVFHKVKELGLEKDVIFLGFVPREDVPLLYNIADLFAFPSLYEGFGLPVLEAMACGTPVVTSNISSLPEVAQDAALLVDPYNVGELAKAMQRVLTDKALQTQLCEKGLAQARKFSWEKTAKKIISIYEEAYN